MFSKSINKEHYGYLFIAPFFIIFLIFSLYPILYSFYISFTQWDGISDPVFVGVHNYKMILQDRVFGLSILNTWFIWLVAVVPQLGLGLILAVILNEKFIKAKHLFRAVYFFPNIVTAASIGVLVSFIFDWQTGGLNRFLIDAGFLKDPVNWLTYPLFARLLNSLVLFWQWFGYSMIIYVAGLQGISGEILEAAEIDGASKVQIFFKVTVPMLKPIIIFQVITSLIGGMQIFDVPYTLTDGAGAPEKSTLTMVMYLYISAFKNNNYGYGATIAYSLFILILIFSLISLKLTHRKETV
jgi:cellobiose transport system permease protein